MKHIAITGGIGSGKSYVCRLLEQEGIAVYDCDAAAKRLMATDRRLQQQLCRLAGDGVYRDGVLQKAVLAQFLLQSEAHKQAVNDVVHPAVACDFLGSGMEWLESAILFESGFHRRVPFDACVCVSAPLEVRLARIMQRDGISREKAMQWISCQMPMQEVESRCQYVILNDGSSALLPQLRNVISQINQS